MRVHYLQHVPFEGPGSIRRWLGAHGAKVSFTALYEGGALPKADDVDLLIVMGGPMSANDEDAHPWLIAEKQLIGETIARGRRVLGICLGAQLVASALGARVYRNAVAEIGWFPVSVSEGGSAGLAVPDGARVFHWHGETFDLPPGATRLASTLGCLNQAFEVGPHVLGLQFHLEVTPESGREMVAHGRDELVAGRFIQPEAELLAAPLAWYAAINRMMDETLAAVTRIARVPRG